MTQATTPRIDARWFKNRIAERQLSMRRLSKAIGLDESAMSLILAGKRGVSPQEAKEIADQLMVPLQEVMRHMGVEVLDDVRKVRIVGHIAGDGAVHLRETDENVIGPADLPADAIALQFRTVGGPMYRRDGWLAFTSSTQSAPAQCVGVLCVAAERDTGALHLATIERGYKAGLFNLLLESGQLRENVDLEWATPILWLRPRQ